MFEGSLGSFHDAAGGTYLGTTRASSPFLLALPKLHPEIPISYRQSAHPSLEQMVRQFGRLGTIRQDDLTKEATVASVLKEVWQRELADSLGSMKLLSIDVDVYDGKRSTYYGTSHDDYDPEEQGRAFFSLGVTRQPVVFIGARLDELEKLKPGLAQTVYAALDRCAWGSLGIFTIDFALEGMPWLYNLEEREDEDGNIDPNDPEEQEGGQFDGLPTRKELQANTPEWVMNPQLMLTPDDVGAVAESPDTPEWAKEALRAVLRMSKAWETGHHKLGCILDEDQESFYQLATIRFNEQDQIGRIADDYEHMANQCSDNYTELSHFDQVDLSDKEKVREWWEGVLAGCRLIKSIDDVLSSLSTE